MRADAEALYNANQRGLFRYFCRAVGHAETARDLTQDVFVRVSRSVIPAAPEAALRGWLFQIARNLALDHHRSGQRRPPAEPLTDTPAGVAGHRRGGQRSPRLAGRSRSRRVPDARGRGSRLRRDRHGVRTDAGRRAVAHPPRAPAAARAALDADCIEAGIAHAPVRSHRPERDSKRHVASNQRRERSERWQPRGCPPPAGEIGGRPATARSPL